MVLRDPDTAAVRAQVAWTCPEAVSPHLEHFIGPWCAALRHLQDGIEKEHAFLGLCDVVRLNPQVRGAACCFCAAAVPSVPCGQLAHGAGPYSCGLTEQMHSGLPSGSQLSSIPLYKQTKGISCCKIYRSLRAWLQGAQA